MLLARGQREHEAAIPCPVDSLAGEPARHLPHKLLLGRDDAAEWPAIAERYSERLSLHGDDVRLYGRTNDAERDRLGDGND